jgi:MFS family permease
VRNAIQCWEPRCKDSGWDAKSCVCTASLAGKAQSIDEKRGIAARIVRDGKELDVTLADPKAVQRAGDLRLLSARPVLPINPWWLGAFVFLMSLCVIGTHGLLSGTATMDFGGRKGAATAVGVIDGFVYLGTALQSVSLGFLTTRDWSYWPWFLMPFSVLGFVLCLRIWSAKPGGKPAH